MIRFPRRHSMREQLSLLQKDEHGNAMSTVWCKFSAYIDRYKSMYDVHIRDYITFHNVHKKGSLPFLPHSFDFFFSYRYWLRCPWFFVLTIYISNEFEEPKSAFKEFSFLYVSLRDSRTLMWQASRKKNLKRRRIRAAYKKDRHIEWKTTRQHVFYFHQLCWRATVII